MTPQLAMLSAILVSLVLIVMVSLIAGIAIAFVVLKATIEENKKSL